MSDENSSKSRVLIVDDHPLVREWLTNLINQSRDLVVCAVAATAAEAMEAVGASNPEAAVMDISLRDYSGIELIKDLKRISPDLLVLVLSMHDESVYAERALRAGARGYIMKRETTGKVIEALHRVLEGKFYISEAIAQTITAQFVSGKPHSSTSPLESLSDRELVVFNLLGEGQGTRQIAENLRVSIKTVQAYCARIKEKLNLCTAVELIREAVRHNRENDVD
jgi:DNA-binding NarL/FixJ family response regulator